MPFLPDPENSIEMKIIMVIAGGAVRTTDTFIMFFALLILYVIARVILEVIIYLFRLYRDRAFTPSPHIQNFRILLGTGVVVLLVSFLLSHLAIGFAIFSVASAAYDWYAGRNAKQEAPELEELNLKDIVAMQQLVNKAYDDGFMARK
jgi:hypothetical protein